MYKLFWPGFYHFCQRLCARYNPQRVGITLASEVGLWLKTILHHMWKLCHLARIERPDTTQFHPSARFAAGPDFKFWVTWDVCTAGRHCRRSAAGERNPFPSQEWTLPSCLITWAAGDWWLPHSDRVPAPALRSRWSMNWNDSTSYRPEFRSLENSWLILLELFVCLPTLHGLLNSDTKFWEVNLSRGFTPHRFSFGWYGSYSEPWMKHCASRINKRRSTALPENKCWLCCWVYISFLWMSLPGKNWSQLAEVVAQFLWSSGASGQVARNSVRI